MGYEPKRYWGERFAKAFDLSGVGHIGFSVGYNRWLYRGQVRALRKAMKDCKISVRNKTVLDLGSGTGFFIEFYHALGVKSVTGVDITSKSIEILKARFPGDVFYQLDIGRDSLKELGKFDIVNIFGVLYHLKEDTQFAMALKNIGTVLSPGAALFLTDLLGEEDIDVAAHVKFRSLRTYTAMFEKDKIKILSINPLYHFLNRPFPESLTKKSEKWQNRVIKFDNYFAWFVYLLDLFAVSQKNTNMRLLVGKKG